MEKMSSQGFSAGMDKFLKTLECQPNLVAPRHAGKTAGEGLAEMAAAFIDGIHKLRGDRVGGSTDQ